MLSKTVEGEDQMVWIEEPDESSEDRTESASPWGGDAAKGMEPTSPGWYSDPQGVHTHQAYWDGETWTGETRPGPGGYTWEEAAVELGIDVVKRSRIGSNPKVLAGKVSSCEVTVSFDSGQGVGGPSNPGGATTKFAVEPPTDFPFRSVRPRMSKRVSSRSFRSGDPEWDQRFVVKTKDHDASHLFLTAERRAIFERLDSDLQSVCVFEGNEFVVKLVGRGAGDVIVRIVRNLVRFANGLASGKLTETPDV